MRQLRLADFLPPVSSPDRPFPRAAGASQNGNFVVAGAHGGGWAYNRRWSGSHDGNPGLMLSRLPLGCSPPFRGLIQNAGIIPMACFLFEAVGRAYTFSGTTYGLR